MVRLSIILGHSDVSTTMKYLHLLTEDVQRPHQALSVLARFAALMFEAVSRDVIDCNGAKIHT